MRKVMINQGRTVPLTFRFVGIGIVFVIVVKVLQHFPENTAILITIPFSFLVPMLWFSSTVLTINPETKEFHLGTWAMGFKTGRPKPYNHIEKIFINKVNVSQTMNTRANSHTTSHVEYRAFIKFDNEEKHFLVSNKSEKKLEERVAEIKKKLGIN